MTLHQYLNTLNSMNFKVYININITTCVFVIILLSNRQSLKGRIDSVSLLLQYRASLAAGACSFTSPLADIRGRGVETLWQLQPSNRKGCANSLRQSSLNLIFSKEAEQRLWHQIFSSSKRTM